MKRLNLSAYQVEEMSQQEMLVTEGGSIFSAIGKAAKAVGKAVATAAVAVADAAVWAWESFLPNENGGSSCSF